MSFALWAALDFSRRRGLMAFSIILMLSVRPHIATIMMVAVIGAIVFDSHLVYYKRLLLGIVTLLLLFLLVPYTLDYTGLGQTDRLIDYIEERQNLNLEGGAGDVEISSLSFPMQLFTYMFRPTIFEFRGFASFAAAIDNLIILALFLILPFYYSRNHKADSRRNIKFLWIYSLIAWSVLSLTTANLGIALRQKWMFAPMLIFIILSYVNRNYVKKN